MRRRRLSVNLHFNDSIKNSIWATILLSGNLRYEEDFNCGYMLTVHFSSSCINKNNITDLLQQFDFYITWDWETKTKYFLSHVKVLLILISTIFHYTLRKNNSWPSISLPQTLMLLKRLDPAIRLWSN